MAQRVVVEQETCIGCGTCESICPEVFRLDEATGKSEVIAPPGNPAACVDEAIDSCPAEAIHWEDE